MRKKIFAATFAVVIAILLPAILASAQDLHKTYAIGAGGRIQIKNVSGDIKVVGYKGDSIIVDAVRTGRDMDQVKVEDSSTGDQIDLRVRYPENCRCDASVNFEVRVPAFVNYNFDRLGSVSGSIDVIGVRGRLRAESVSGSVTVKDIAGIVSASSVSGNVEAEITRLEGSGDMKFSSVSGNVNVKAPSNTDASVDMSTVSGSLDTNFPIEIQEPGFGPGRSAHGRLGVGANSLRISSISGKVSFSRN